MRKTEIKAETISGAFPNEETFEKVYSECTENQPQASEAVKSNYRGMREAFDEYINAIQEDMFRYVYQCGYEAAVAAFTKGDDAI